MPTRPKFFPPSVSRYLDPKERSWDTVVAEEGKLVLDSEKILEQDLLELDRLRDMARTVPSGWVRGQSRGDAYNEFSYDAPWLAGPVLNPDFTPNAFHMQKVQALVAGMLLDIEYVETDTKGDNLIVLDVPDPPGAPPVFKRTDFVFLEVWLALVSDSPSARGSLTVNDPVVAAPGDTITVDGLVFTGVLIPPAANQFQIFGGSPTNTATSIATQINASAAAVTAVANANIVQITADVSGVAGNAITLGSSNPAGILASGGFLTGGADTPNKPTQDSIYRHGNVDSSAAVALPDDIEDPAVGAETTKRVQIQYRIRHTGMAEGIDFKLQNDGFSNPNILAQGSQVAPVALYPFVPADLKTVIDNSDARDGVAGPDIGYGLLDNGLWIAGEGTATSATDLGTIDGFVYAIPLCMVFRRNDATGSGGFNPENNTNGGILYNHAATVNPFLFNTAVAVGESDRPDGAFADAIVDTDVLDLRRHVKFTGQDLAAETQYQMQALQDGAFRTWAIDTASKQVMGGGSGDVSTRNLVANEIGRTGPIQGTPPAKGGNPPFSGDTTRGVTIRNFDHFARRFGDQPVVERVVLELLPTDDEVGPPAHPGKFVVRPAYAAAFLGWAEGDEINIDLLELNATTLGDFDPNNVVSIPGPAPTGTVLDYAPPGSIITDILSLYHDDGNFNVIVDQTLKPTTIIGLGTSHVQITLDINPTQVTGGLNAADHDMVGTNGTGDVGSPRRVFVELELTYPLGVGLTDTPDLEVVPDPSPYPYGPMLEDWVSAGPDQRPLDMEDRLAPSFRQGFREVMVEYIANDPTAGGGNTGIPIGTLTLDTIVSRDPLSLVLDRRFYGDAVTSVLVTDADAGTPRDVDDPNSDFGSSTRLAVLNNTGFPPAIPLSGAGQTLCEVRYFAQDPIPNFGGAGLGYQQVIYFRTNAPQTVGTKEGVISTTIQDFPYTGAVGPLPSTLEVEPLYISPNVWTGQVGMGSVELPFPYFAPLDQLPVNDGSTEIPPAPDTFPGEYYFAATANISIDDFDAETGTLALHALVPADGSTDWTLGGTPTTDVPFKDAEFRAVYPVINRSSHRPTAMGQGMSNVVRHKVFQPVLVRAGQDSSLFRKDEVLLLVLTRWAVLDANNDMTFADAEGNTGVGVFRTKNLLMTAGNQE
jgi:hypothetical protein